MDQLSARRRVSECGIIAADAFSTNCAELARALFESEIDVIEARGRWAESITAITGACHGILVGAGDISSADECRCALSAGADFISGCGLDAKIAEVCLEAGALYIPSCATAGEVYKARAMGLTMVKLFPIETLGRVAFIQALSKRFPEMLFIPEGQFASGEIGAYASLKCVAAVSMDNLRAESAREAMQGLLGFALYHVGINTPDAAASQALAQRMSAAFGFDVAEGPFAFYASQNLELVRDLLTNAKGEACPGPFYQTADLEIMKSMFRGKNGHIGIRANDAIRAVAHLKKRGFKVDESSMFHAGGRIFTVYLSENGEFGDFAIHLLQK